MKNGIYSPELNIPNPSHPFQDTHTINMLYNCEMLYSSAIYLKIYCFRL